MLHDFIPLTTQILKIAIAFLLLLAAASDLTTRTVPNWISLALAVLCTGLAATAANLPWGLAFGLAIFALCFACWHRGWLGGADVKLLGAAAIAVGPTESETFLLAVTLSGGVLALAYLAGRVLLPRPAATHPRLLPARILRIEAWRIRRRAPLPYACAIAAGTLFVLT